MMFTYIILNIKILLSRPVPSGVMFSNLPILADDPLELDLVSLLIGTSSSDTSKEIIIP